MTVVLHLQNIKAACQKALFLAVLALILAGCKKEYQQLPYTDIISFSITDAKGEVLKAALDKNDIVLYWPPEQAIPDYITPLIKVAEGAIVNPASGTRVAFKENTTFTVTAQNGKTTVYKIKPAINSVIPYIKSANGFRTVNQKTIFVNGDVISVTGDYFSTEKDKTKLFFISNDNKEVELKNLSVKPIEISVQNVRVPTGRYKGVKLQSNDRIVMIEKDFVLIDDPQPFISPDFFQAPQTLKRGDRFSITGGRNLKVVNKVELVTTTGNKLYELKIAASDNDKLVLEIPADFPAGEYAELRYSYPAGEYLEAGRRRIFLEDNEAYITIVIN